MSISVDLERFVVAQDAVIHHVFQELRDGHKRTHWMWFVFPQLVGLGSSATARHFAIASLAEAEAYLQHPVLGPRLVDCTELVNKVEGRSINAIFGSPDDLKLHSSMTLFASVTAAPPAFMGALEKYFGDVRDPRTDQLLA